MRVLVCGSRTWTNEMPVTTMLRGLFLQRSVGKITIIEGGARGADSIAALWAEGAIERGGAEFVEHLCFPADWDQHGKRAGYIRNVQMLKEGKPDLVLAFRCAGESKGTDMMVDLARKAGVPTWVVSAE